MHSETFWDIALDPNHIMAEIVWNVIFDGVVVAFLYGVVFKKVILPKIRREIHREIDSEHGIEPHD
jgi:hypothetical protein